MPEPAVPKTALCFCPDAAYFRPAALAARSVIAAGDAQAFDIFIVCEAKDVAPDFAAFAAAQAQPIHLLIVDFAARIGDLQGRDRFPATIYRRLFLDSLLPERYQRIVYLDADILIAREGLSRLAKLDFRGLPFAAAYDMIFLLDFRLDGLARRFRAYRQKLGLDVATPYFNSGVMAIDRAAWRGQDLTRRTLEALAAEPERFDYPEQSALNHLVAGGFAPLSPRYNFMGDFFLLGLEDELAPIALHFVNTPKPWNYGEWRGEARFARAYDQGFQASPWPDWAAKAPLRRERKPRMTLNRRRFAERLRSFLSAERFIDLT